MAFLTAQRDVRAGREGSLTRTGVLFMQKATDQGALPSCPGGRLAQRASRPAWGPALLRRPPAVRVVLPVLGGGGWDRSGAHRVDTQSPGGRHSSSPPWHIIPFTSGEVEVTPGHLCLLSSALGLNPYLTAVFLWERISASLVVSTAPPAPTVKRE